MKYEAVVAQLLNVEGALAAGVVDYDSGMLLAGSSINAIDLEISAISSTEVVRAQIKNMQMLQLNDVIEDILITLNNRYHLIRPLRELNSLFLYSVLDKQKASLALSRRALIDVEKQMLI
ncbi:hypothetical protein PT286_00390 [Neisseriaceae bacterium ESL0693]|nr:hypothetical protein [Neisseriaceae bacterium ESL0693]